MSSRATSEPNRLVMPATWRRCGAALVSATDPPNLPARAETPTPPPRILIIALPAGWTSGQSTGDTGLPRVRASGPRKAAAGAVGDLHLVLPRQAILPRHEVVHVGIRTILRAAADGDEAAMAELVDVVLDAPHAAGLAGQRRANLAGDDLVGHTGARDQRRAVEVDDHAFAHRVEGAIGAAHADVRRVQIGRASCRERAECTGVRVCMQVEMTETSTTAR